MNPSAGSTASAQHTDHVEHAEHAEYTDLAQGSLPSRHQRRILVCAGPAPTGHRDLHRATARWQRQYIGGVFVRVPATGAEQRRVVAEFTAAGCSPQTAHFYRPGDLAALRPLAHRIAGLLDGSDCDPVGAAELLVVGATDVVGPCPARDLALARAVAAFVNTRLGEDWLVRPEATPVPATAGPADERQAQRDLAPAELEDHFADTARALAAEAECRLEMFDRLPDDAGTRVPHYAVAGPCPAVTIPTT
ncbi:hypothetical protein AB0D65_07250 [Streptomyces griseoloalbus]|uniref:Uncharacterized protein n=1 Tax=Streptomyces griseoloalbus TaxID=67303 RepID=A0ABV3E1S4_9ACTN